MFKFIHTADWQIGKGFANIPVETAVMLRSKRIEAVATIAQLACRRKVDAVLVAGDIFDSNCPCAKAIHQIYLAMSEFDGIWILLPGNHDPSEPKSVWSRLKENMPSKQVILATEPTPIFLCNGSVVILPAPLQRRHEKQDLTQWFDSFVTPGVIRVGLAHGSADIISERGDSPNTISASRTASAALDYLALGDWHGTLRIHERLWYSGTPEPDRFRNNDSGNVLAVEISEPGATPVVEKIVTRHYLWCQERLPVFELADIDSLEERLLAAATPFERLLIRLVIEGTVTCEVLTRLELELERLGAQLAYLQVDKTALIGRPDTFELDEIEQTGFVRSAINKLLAVAEGAPSPESDTAKLALQILYLEHKKIGMQT